MIADGRARQAEGSFPRLAEMSPAYFGLVMATGIISLAASMMEHDTIALGLFYLNIGQYAVLCALYVLRAWRYPHRFFGDMVAHLTGPGYFTTVAGTGILASQFMVLRENVVVGKALWMLAILLWVCLTYTIFTAFTVRRDKPALDGGINGGWLLAVVATQALSISSALLAARIAQPYRLELNLMALSMWLWGGMLYIWMMSLIFYRYAFFRFSPGDLAPPYWINMGAMAISTLAGSLLILNAPHAPFLTSLLPFLKGFTVFYWATGTWWIPMLLLLGIWRYAYERFPFQYDPLYWGAVFPIGMYAACTWQMDRAMEFGFLTFLPRSFLYIALSAWTMAFFGMVRGLVRILNDKAYSLSLPGNGDTMNRVSSGSGYVLGWDDALWVAGGKRALSWSTTAWLRRRLPDRWIGRRPDGMKRRPLIFRPAGVFFALAAMIAAILPWLWLLPLEDPGQAHVRLGIFGFGGMAVSGYLLTAQRAWTGLEAPLPTAGLAALALGARMLALAEPQSIWLVCLPLLVVALAILLPVLYARRWDKAPLALVPLGLVIAEGALVWQQIQAAALPLAMGALILAVGGRMIAAFLIEERRRRGLPQRAAAPVWPGLAMMGVGAASRGAMGTSALAITALWVLHRAWGGLGAWPTNRMLGLGYAALAAGLLGIAASRLGILPQLAQVHLLTMGAMGSMIVAVAARVSMRRIEGMGLMPLTRHWVALWLVFAATGARCLAEMAAPHHALMIMAGIAWSAAWLLFLSAHLAALRHPAPFPLLSAERARSKPP